jgi:hypothetical protein
MYGVPVSDIGMEVCLHWRRMPFNELIAFGSAFIGLAWLFITIPLPGYVAARVRTIQKIALKKTDARVGTVTESEYRVL